LKNKIITEIEIKVTINDLYNELKKGKKTYNGSLITKHNIIENTVYNCPNKYYFCVPTNMLKETIDFANKMNKKYGVIEFTNKPINRCLRIAKKTYMLHNIDNSLNYSKRMIDRLSNDLANKYHKLYWK
jgi:predicted DNA-binding protein (UPF0278 family)